MSKADRTRAFILEKTAPIFNSKGFAGTSLTDLTLATGLTKGSIYGNFANKDEVALAVFDYNLKKLLRSINTEVAQEEGAKAKLLAYANCYEIVLSPQIMPGGCPILNTAVDADDTHPELRDKAMAAISSWKNKIIQIIDDGLSSGELLGPVDKEQFALTMIAMIEGSAMIAKLSSNNDMITMVMKSLKQLIKDLK